MKVALHGYVAIPQQVFISLFAGTPDGNDMPGETDDGHDKESNGQSQEDKCIFRCPIIIAIVVAALEGLLFLVLKSVVLLDSRLEHTFVEPYHNI